MDLKHLILANIILFLAFEVAEAQLKEAAQVATLTPTAFVLSSD